MKHLRFLLFLPLMAATTLTMAQDKKRFTLDDLIPGGSTYYANTPERKYVAWWGDNCVELDIDQVSFIDTKSGQSSPLFTLEDINGIIEADRPVRSLYNVSFPYPGQPLVMLQHAGKQMLVDWTQKKVVWSVLQSPSATHTDFQTDTKQTAYTKDHNLYVQGADGQVSQVSNDGSLDVVYGESVHRNEFGIEKGTFWSPKGKRLAFYRMDQSMVSDYPQVDISTRCATMNPDKYPMAGEISHKVQVGIYDSQTHNTIYLQTQDPTDRYFTNIAWSPDEQKIYLIELNRDQNHAQLIRYNALTGEKEAMLFEERNDKYVEPLHPIVFLPWDNDKFIYQTRRDGYNHFYLYNTDGKLLRQLTKGAFEVIELLGFNTKNKQVVFTSNEMDPIGIGIWSVGMNGKKKSLGEKSGYHHPELSSEGNYVIDRYSSPTHPYNIDIVNVANAKATNIHHADDPWKDYDVPEIKVGTIKAADDSTDLYYRLILPTDFDPTKKYPAVVYVYGGPHAHNIDASRNWGARGWDLWMAQNGYVMFCLDNRGSEHRGLAFEQATFRQLGVEEMKDQLRGVDYLKSLPYVDANRLGVHGWSFGGFMTTSLMTTYPDVFKVGVAGGPVIDWKYYEVMYGERYMDTPQANPDGYAKTSLLGKAQNLKGRLMVIYGGNDDICVPQHTLSFMRACIDAGTHPDLFVYPGDGHNMMGTDRIHLHEHITRYFEDYLK